MRYKLINRVQQPLMLARGAVIFEGGFLIIDEAQYDDQVKHFEKMGFITVKKCVFDKTQR